MSRKKRNRIDRKSNRFDPRRNEMKGMQMTTNAKVQKTETQRVQSVEEVRAEVRLAAYTKLRDTIKADEFDDVAKLSKDTLAVMAREEQTAGAQVKTRFFIARTLAKDKDQLANYVGATTPEIRKALTGQT